ncbi:hypothetical protein GJ496_003987 [Pomphorhynchus laevis]|nr:hypothetical protein GJ496_003987 [Pomphorhynchus laevis]
MSSERNYCGIQWKDYATFKFHSLCICHRNLHGTVTIITGANSGIGYEATKILADRGSKVIMACRSEYKAKMAKDIMLRENINRDIVVEIVDVSSLASVRSFAQRICSQYDKIDILINNAGVMTDSCLSEDGYEIHFATNHLGHFLLTNLLLDKLKKSPDARIINVSSAAHLIGRFEESHLRKPAWISMLAYADSKFCNILFTKELNKHLKGTTVTTFAVHPGIVATNMVSQFLPKFIFSIGEHLVFKTPIQGVQTIIHAALNNEIKQYSGQYFGECNLSHTKANLSYADMLAIQLWYVSEQYTGFV